MPVNQQWLQKSATVFIINGLMNSETEGFSCKTKTNTPAALLIIDI